MGLQTFRSAPAAPSRADARTSDWAAVVPGICGVGRQHPLSGRLGVGAALGPLVRPPEQDPHDHADQRDEGGEELEEQHAPSILAGTAPSAAADVMRTDFTVLIEGV
jgi:hypothetical protein